VSRHTEEFLDLCAARALGTLDDVSNGRLDAHLAEGCPECEAALRDFGSAVIALAGTAPAVAPSAALRERVRAAVAREPRRPAAEKRPRRVATMALAAASVVFLTTSVLLWNRVRELSNERSTLLTRIETTERELADARGLDAFVTGPNTDCFDLAGTTEEAAALAARVCFDAGSGNALVVLDRVSAPSGRDYELWVLRGETPTSLGVVRADAAGHAVVRLESLADADAVTAFAVSLEPAGGSTAAGPTGPVVMVGALD
jgi:anti-sigma-K factor RskA